MKVAVRLFAGLRELAGTRATEIELPAARPLPMSGRRSSSAPSRRGCCWPSTRLRVARHGAPGGRRGRADPARLGRRVPALRGAALVDDAVREVASRRCRRDRHVHRDDARALARARGRSARVRGVRGHGRGRDGAHRGRPRRAARPHRRRDPPPRRRRRHRRHERRDRRLVRPPRRARSPPAPRRSTRSRARCRCGRRRSTSAARNGSGRARERRLESGAASLSPSRAAPARRRGWARRILAPLFVVGGVLLKVAGLAQVPRRLPRGRRLRADLGLALRRSASSFSSSSTSSGTTSRRSGRG